MSIEEEIEKEAVRWVRRQANRKFLLEKFASAEIYLPDPNPVMFFTAGSPGAGKTEFIKGLCGEIEVSQQNKVVIIDPDQIRELLPGYTGMNSFLFQRAVSIVVDDLFRHVQKNHQNVFIDGTFSNYERARKNIESSLETYKVVNICYVFQYPSIAWHFTQIREEVEGRNIQREDFVKKLLDAKTTVDKVVQDFGKCVKLYIIQKEYLDTAENKVVANVYEEVFDIEKYIDFIYTEDNVKRILDEESI